MWRSEFYGKGDFSYADFLYTFGVIDEVASLGDLVGGREIYTISLEVAKINMSKMFMTISFNIWIHKSTVLMFRTNRHCIFFYFITISWIEPLAAELIIPFFGKIK